MAMRIMILVLACVSCGPDVVDRNLRAESHSPLPSGQTAEHGLEVKGTHALDCLADLPPYAFWARNQGWGSGSNASTALAAAVQDARRRLMDERGRDLSAIEKQELARAIDTSYYRPKSRCRGGSCEACAVAIVQSTKLGPSLGEAGWQLADALRTCVGTFCGQFSGRQKLRVRVSAPVWADGRSAEKMGPALAMQLKGALGGANDAGAPELVFVGQHGGRVDVTLGGELSQHADGCSLVLRYRIEGEDYWHYLEPATFHPRALALRDCRPPPETFVSDSRMGLEQGERTGSGGLRFEAVEAPIVDGRLCEGSAFVPKVRLNQRAWLRVYSVTSDGRVMLGWVSDKAVTRWSPKSDNPAVPIRMDDDQQYRIVFVAVPEDAGPEGFGQELLDQTFCVAPTGTGLDLRRLPVEGAAQALTFSVVEPGRGDCPEDPEGEALVRRLREVLDGLRECN